MLLIEKSTVLVFSNLVFLLSNGFDRHICSKMYELCTNKMTSKLKLTIESLIFKSLSHHVVILVITTFATIPSWWFWKWVVMNNWAYFHQTIIWIVSIKLSVDIFFSFSRARQHSRCVIKYLLNKYLKQLTIFWFF